MVTVLAGGHIGPPLRLARIVLRDMQSVPGFSATQTNQRAVKTRYMLLG
jgi:hypothetical protein